MSGKTEVFGSGDVGDEIASTIRSAVPLHENGDVASTPCEVGCNDRLLEVLGRAVDPGSCQPLGWCQCGDCGVSPREAVRGDREFGDEGHSSRDEPVTPYAKFAAGTDHPDQADLQGVDL